VSVPGTEPDTRLTLCQS